jgi:hypothetical protein
MQKGKHYVKQKSNTLDAGFDYRVEQTIYMINNIILNTKATHATIKPSPHYLARHKPTERRKTFQKIQIHRERERER